ncbi:MAG TPA: hypothetical protein EYQ63_08085 [Fuerstia sp.]|nr:hypothetical protein [Fuerstiella sp.]
MEYNASNALTTTVNSQIQHGGFRAFFHGGSAATEIQRPIGNGWSPASGRCGIGDNFIEDVGEL